MLKRVEGILCAAVTPLDGEENLDREGAQRLLTHITDSGVDGILALGSTGEQIALDRKAKKDMIRCARETIPSGMPLIAGCGATSTRLAIRNVHDAEEEGADAVIVTPPCFYPFDENALEVYYRAIARESHVPVYLYNISRFVGVRIPAETVRRLQDEPKIMGIKESDRDLAYVKELLAVSAGREDFAVIQGSERVFLESFDMGCPAGVTVVGNVEAGPVTALQRAWKAGDRERAEALQNLALEYVKAVTILGKFPQELKIALEAMGICSSRMTSPFPETAPEEKQKVIDALKRLEKQKEALL